MIKTQSLKTSQAAARLNSFDYPTTDEGFAAFLADSLILAQGQAFKTAATHRRVAAIRKIQAA